MRVLVGLLGGLLLGALGALLFAPKSGMEFRGQLTDEASIQLSALRRHLEQTIDVMQRQLTDLQNQMSALAKDE